MKAGSIIYTTKYLLLGENLVKIGPVDDEIVGLQVCGTAYPLCGLYDPYAPYPPFGLQWSPTQANHLSFSVKEGETI